MVALSSILQSVLVFVLTYSMFARLCAQSSDEKEYLSRKSPPDENLIEEVAVDTQTFDFPMGEINRVLYKQALSHHSLHRPHLQKTLASLAGVPKTMMIVGVEWGADLVNFASLGYKVIAFEPMPRFYKKLRQIVDNHPTWNVQIFNKAAGNQTSKMKIFYQNQMSDRIIQVVRIDDLIKEPVSIVSVDVQGSEFNVLQGAEGLLRKYVKILWFEAIACNQRLLSILQLLDDNFVFFDFVPVGTPHKTKHLGWNKRENFLFEDLRPSSFYGYYHWLCNGKQHFLMLQSDILAVHRSIIDKVWPQLSIISSLVCNKPGSNCFLRSLINNASTN